MVAYLEKKMNDLQTQTKAWLELINQPPLEVLLQNPFAPKPIENPIRSVASPHYLVAQRKDQKDIDVVQESTNSDVPPTTMYDGMQTTINLCRVNAGFDPLDPKGKGDAAHFIKFTNNVASVPFITLNKASTSEVKQQSHDSSALIASFVGAFEGMLAGDAQMLTKSLKGLTNAALSYAGQEERQSNFSQTMLQTGGGDAVLFFLYASVFTIQVTQSKGTITYKTQYELRQASYSLSQTAWLQVKDVFAKQTNIDTKKWLESMQTPQDQQSEVTVECL